MTQRPRATDLVCAALLLLAALAARLPGINGDLWLDEAWVANSILTPTWREMFFYEPWLQTTPPLHLIVTRLLVAVLGDANWVFRTLPLLFGLGGVFLAVRLGRRFYSPLMGWLAGALVALSSSAAMFSKEGKSYSGELCAALLLMLLVVELPAWWIATGVMLLAFGFSYTSVMFFPGVFLAYLFARRLRISDAAGMLVGLGLPLALTFLLYIQPNRGDDLREFWRGLFPQGNPLAYYLTTTKEIFVSHQWLPLQTISAFRYMVLVLALAGIGRGTLHLWRDRDARLALAALLPIACAITLNFAGVYPYGGERTCFYLEACVVVLVVSGVDWVLPKSGLSSAALPVLLMAAAVGATWFGVWPRRVDVGLDEARQELGRQSAGPGDLVFVAPLLWESWTFAQRHGKLSMETIEGRLFPACCPRDGRWTGMASDTDVKLEMDPLIARGTGRRIWLLHMRLELLPPGSQSIPETWHRAYLVTKGCREEFAREYQSTVLSAYRCPLL